jgi:translation initiation factor IF-2
LEIVLSKVAVKGIRVNQLAKELGVESKSILNKCREEGLGEKVPNHMSVLSVGLAETVREWFSGGDSGGSTAVQTAPPVETLTKPKARKIVKKSIDQDEEPDNGSIGDETASPASVASPIAASSVSEPKFVEAVKPIVPIAPPIAIPVAESSASAAPTPVGTASPVIEAPKEPFKAPAHREQLVHKDPHREHSEPTTQPKAEVPRRVAPVVPPAVAATAPVAPPQPPTDSRQPLRKTITLADRNTPPQHIPERKIIVPAPKLLIPKPAVIQGPNIVREETPDHVAPLRRPGVRPPGGQASDSPSFVQARTKGGGGVVRVEEDEEEAKKKAAAAKKGSLSTRRRGLDGRRGEATEKLREFTEADLIARRDALNAATSTRAGVDRHLKQVSGRGQHTVAKTTVQKGEPIEIEEPITVRSLSAAMGIKTNDIISKLMRQGKMVTINQTLEVDTAQTLALEYGLELEIVQQASMEELLMDEFEARETTPENLKPRPPVVTILGHVDHGKTSLLDKIRNANVAAGEAGGITQHTAAWMVTVGEGDTARRVTFIDTPGHQAFTSMRARGANMTDVVVLVVAAVEGVMPQTVESINHAKAAGVPIVVAMSKIDRPDANPDMVLGQLAGNGLNPVEWGGETEVIRTSAVTGAGIKELIEMLAYQADLLDLKADPTAPARGSVIESNMVSGLGAVATVLIQNGTLKPGDIVLSGGGYGRVRTILNDRGETITKAGPSMPVIVSGLNQLPDAGDKLFVLDDMDRAKSIAEERSTNVRQTHLSSATRVTLDNLFATMDAGDVKTINLIIKGDVQGSVETLAKTVTDQNTAEVKVRVIHSAVGAINESDVELADASNAVIIGFHVAPETSARAMAEQRRVEIRLYDVIYQIFDDLKKALSGMLEPEIREKLHGHAEIRQVFKFSKVGSIAGCMVTDGHIQRGSKIRLIRNGVIITEDLSIETLKRVKDDVKEVKSGFECGIKVAGYDDIKVGDVFEAYIKETIQRTL